MTRMVPKERRAVVGEATAGQGKTTENNRAFVRVAVDAFVRVLGHDREYVFRTRDLSEGDLFLHTRVGHLYPFAIGSEVAIEIQEGEHVASVNGVVVRISPSTSTSGTDEPTGFALRLHAPDEGARTLLKSIVARARQHV